MREPRFWYGPPSVVSALLSPVAQVYGAVTGRRMARQGVRVGIPVICIGNYHLGGAGKTPTTLALSQALDRLGERPFVVSRGYGGDTKGPIRVTTAHRASQVGDEPLMMAKYLPVVVARDRVAGAALAQRDGASVVLLDDGFQNPGLIKDSSLAVIDAARGLGNGQVFPAGPLRAPLVPQLARTDAMIVIGKGDAAEGPSRAVALRGGLVLHAEFEPDAASLTRLRGQRVLAFAGIGDPARFFATLRTHGVDVAEEKIFDDHHRFTVTEIEALVAQAKARSLTLVTTEKDVVRLTSDAILARYADEIVTLAVKLKIVDEVKLSGFLQQQLQRARS